MHRTGSSTLHPAAVAGITVVGKTTMLVPALRETTRPPVGASAVITAVQVDGSSFIVRVVSNQTCGSRQLM